MASTFPKFSMDLCKNRSAYSRISTVIQVQNRFQINVYTNDDDQMHNMQESLIKVWNFLFILSSDSP